MSKQKSKTSTGQTKPDKTSSNQTLVPLTELQLEMIAGAGGDGDDTLEGSAS